MHSRRREQHTPQECASMAEFVSRHNGKKIIEKVLIANNGIAAVKCIRSIRRWCYETFRNERTVKFVVMVSPEDLEANAEFIRLADQYVPVPGGSNHNNYANCDLIAEIARAKNVQAVWAGWGHASENPKLPDLLAKSGIEFLGPPSNAMRALGDKISSAIIAQSVGLPTLKWSGEGITCENGIVTEKHYKQACVDTLDKAVDEADRIGYPLMIKAANGGGGKGIRKCERKEDFPTLYRQVKAEVSGSSIFLMEFADEARHLEVQLLCDQLGNAISLYGRDCSIQRRHQKIIEEAPQTIAPKDQWKHMEEGAVRLAKLVGYHSTGTVEYLYDPKKERFCFLELNPRLQVEHPCTEMISDVNLPATQLCVGLGISLDEMPLLSPIYETIDGKLNITSQENPRGHVIACRITAENPDEGFRPGSGTVQELNFRSSKNVWGYFSVVASGSLHEYCDSQFGHIFAWGETRAQATSNLGMVLREISIRGDFRTTVEYLSHLIESETFRNSSFSTGWLDHLIATRDRPEVHDERISAICTALHIADRHWSTVTEQYKSALEKGQILPIQSLPPKELPLNLILGNQLISLKISRPAQSSFCIELNNTQLIVSIFRLSDSGILVQLNGVSYCSYLQETAENYRVTINNQTVVFDKEKDPSLITSSSAGKLVRFLVEDGSPVVEGQDVAELEVMKMVMTVKVSLPGKIIHSKKPGAFLSNGSVIARLELGPNLRVPKPQVYMRDLSEFVPDNDSESTASLSSGESHASIRRKTGSDGAAIIAREMRKKSGSTGSIHSTSTRDRRHPPHKQLEKVISNIHAVLDGYSVAGERIEKWVKRLVSQMFAIFQNRRLPLYELREVMTRLSGRIPDELEGQINEELKRYGHRLGSMLTRFPSMRILKFMNLYAAKITNPDDRNFHYVSVSQIETLCHKYVDDIRGLQKSVIKEMLKKFTDIEKHFQSKTFEKSVKEILIKNEDLDLTTKMILSHRNRIEKSKLIHEILNVLLKHDAEMILEMQEEIDEVATLRSCSCALTARQVLITGHQPSFQRRHNQIESIFLSAIDNSANALVFPARLQQLVVSETAIFDVLPEFFYHKLELVRFAALEVYVQRAYTAYIIECVESIEIGTSKAAVEFQFSLPCNHPSRQSSFANIPPPGIAQNRESFPDLCIAGYEYEKNFEELSRFGRTGLMVAYENLEDFENNIYDVLTCFGYLKSEESDEESDSSELTEHPYMSDDDDPYGAKSPPGRGYDPPSDQVFFVGKSRNQGPAVHTLNVFLRSKKGGEDDEMLEKRFREFSQNYQKDFRNACIRRITFAVHKKSHMPKFFTFRSRDEYKEDEIYRHLEPALAFQLELSRLRNFTLKLYQTQNHRMHLYHGIAKNQCGKESIDHRFFVRAIIRHSDLITEEASFSYLRSEGERLLIESLDELEVAIKSHSYKTDQNHVFLNFAPSVNMEANEVLNSVSEVVLKYGRRLWELRVTQAELKINVRQEEETTSYRIFLSSEDGFRLETHLYREVVQSQKTIFVSIGPEEDPGPLNGLSTDTPYSTKDLLQTARYKAQSAGCAYAYDYPSLFKSALKSSWEDRKVKHPKDLFTCNELILDKSGKLHEVTRDPAQNTVGMVAWRMKFSQPTIEGKREIVVISNDSTVQQGSFGPAEDALFAAASKLARDEGIPRIYITGNNSGARIGLSKDIQSCFQVAWKDKEAGLVEYFYLSSTDYSKFSSQVIAEHVNYENESRYKINAIIGSADCGTAALAGSGLIAGETSKAYREIPTISLVTGRAVGIGAYLVRLGQRVVQVESSFVILTGFVALNSVLGSSVYSSNQQLGGPQIMSKNGVSHLTVADDYAGIRTVLHWLSYIPVKGKLLKVPKLICDDPPERQVTVQIKEKIYDARRILAGDDDHLGILDRGSLLELQPDWAKTVLIGRGRLGGIPIGVIAAETRQVTSLVPADPADRNSHEKVITQAGSVWFPDSAFKTAQ
ncbi:Oidioi.mRNA.OKI2018_I69.PAR.g12270.t1.cds [Oikopleura dioica]|uniref:Oidioi.mRNA.OKI2018_I69.PAR.g12270.t1.cds n=1 Tax=Oikopleura dioica TaxID=34765 RepID=A0ABN7RZ99_OIKDI|nr:Oidioi.mRNA.OKI2018_I69.PAR.g12270.t1.cds [Oikopleura dioica]